VRAERKERPAEKHHKTQIETISSEREKQAVRDLSPRGLRPNVGRVCIVARSTDLWLIFAQRAADKKGFIGLHRLTALY